MPSTKRKESEPALVSEVAHKRRAFELAEAELAHAEEQALRLLQDPRTELKRYVRTTFGAYELDRVSLDEDNCGPLWGLPQLGDLPDGPERTALVTKCLRRIHKFNDGIIDGLTDAQVQEVQTLRRLFPTQVLVLEDGNCFEAAEGFVWSMQGKLTLICPR